MIAGRGPSRDPLLAVAPLGFAIVTLAAAFTVGRAVPGMWAHRTYRRRGVAVVALITTLLATWGILATQDAGLIVLVVPSLTLLRLTVKGNPIAGSRARPHTWASITEVSNEHGK
jgi:hypothetical protein